VPGGRLTQIVPAGPRIVEQAPLVTRVAPLAPPVVIPAAPAVIPAPLPAIIPAPSPVARIVQAAPVIRNIEAEEAFDLNPQYNFGYSVSDAVTGDSKSREEIRNGDLVTG
jgi:hypothetical protein